MHLRQSVKDIAVGAGLAAIVSGAVLMAQVGAPKGRQPDGVEVCCSVTAIDAAKGVITAKVTATGKVFTIEEVSAASLAKFAVGATIDLACAVPPNSGTSGATGSAATNGTATTATMSSGNCGSNVSRNANTRPVQPQAPPKHRPTDCVATTGGARVAVACPTADIQIKAAR